VISLPALDCLRFFEAAARHQSFVHAADEFDVENGTIVKAKRIDERRRCHKGRWRMFGNHWRITVDATDPKSTIPVSLEPKACSTEGARCARDGARSRSR
jgi:hypothetical protein